MKRFWFTSMIIAIAVIALGFATFGFAADGSAAPNSGKRIPPAATQHSLAAAERTWEQIDAFEATAVAPARRATTFHPTMDINEYKLLKKNAAAEAKAGRSGSFAPTPLDLASPVLAHHFNGPFQNEPGTGGNWFPPDVAGAIGKTQFVAVHNDIMAVFSRGGAQQKLTSLNSFFGFTTEPMFDPRVLWDPEWQRWIITADSFPQSDGITQILGIAISQTSSATGKWWVYFVDVGHIFAGAGGLYDFPMLGMSQDALLFTANVFTATSFQGSSLFAWAKARVYNGLDVQWFAYTGLIPTMQPSIQLKYDQSAYSWLAAAPSGSGAIYMLALFDPANPVSETLYGYYTVSGVAAYSVPASATQPAPCNTSSAYNVDTSDNRFVNHGTQNGDLYYQAHSVGGLATGRYYIIQGLNSFSPSILVQNNFFHTGPSQDFNVSIAADEEGRFALNWSSIDPTAYNALELFDGALSNGSIGGLGLGKVASASATCLSQDYDSNFGEQRWGDYSQASEDPGTGTQENTNTKYFWLENEIVNASGDWATVFSSVHF